MEIKDFVNGKIITSKDSHHLFINDYRGSGRLFIDIKHIALGDFEYNIETHEEIAQFKRELLNFVADSINEKIERDYPYKKEKRWKRLKQ